MANAGSKGPFRADHVGSLIRPDRLLDARDRFQKGMINIASLRAVEDECIRACVKLQESAGLAAITDGEFRRKVWYADFLTGFDNVKAAGPMLAVKAGGAVSKLNGMEIVGKLKRSRGIQTESFDFLKGCTSRVAKVCIPSPSMLHFRGGRGAIDRAAYPDLDQFWDDVARVYREEIADLVARGLSYLQLDDTNLAYLCDESFRDAVRAIGEDPNLLPHTYCRIINDVIRDVPDHVTVTVHLCRGNARASGVAAGSVARGGYEAIGEALFGGLNVDGFFLEYDDERSGDFAPLRLVPKGKKVVLGLVTTKRRELEGKDGIKRRIDEAARMLPLEQLCLSPQCGFSSGVGTKALSIADEEAKLSRVVETAREVWGAA